MKETTENISIIPKTCCFVFFLFFVNEVSAKDPLTSLQDEVSSLFLNTVDFFEPNSNTDTLLKKYNKWTPSDLNAYDKIRDPDIGRRTPELIESRGFICETHFVTTDDGYILGLHRIIHPKIDLPKEKRKPVIIQHGLTGSSIDFINNSPGGGIDEKVVKNKVGNNLGFELAKRGYDVWLSNTRGNIYSRNHTTLDPEKDKKYWDFSFDEFIQYDSPAIISHVLKTTNRSKVGYIGHSQGTAIMFGLLSTQRKYNDIIEPFIALAPVTTVAYSSTPFNFLVKQRWFRNLLLLKGGKFFPDSFMRFLAKRLCTRTTTNVLCENVIFFVVGGWDSPQLNRTRVPVYAGEESLGTSSKDLVHWSQGIAGKTFNHFDYGSAGNLKKYKRPTPPEYPLEHISCKSIALFYSLQDKYADPEDVQILKNRLKGMYHENFGYLL